VYPPVTETSISLYRIIVKKLDEKRARDGFLSPELEDIYARSEFNLHAAILLRNSLNPAPMTA
jgi:hypothetical protein